jgi:acyl-[acyl carrier protein]--UDP-N-acetylglucosamine O-acyltransferase
MSDIHPTALIYEGVTIGKNVRIGAFCVIGGPPEDTKFFGKPHKSVRIGNNVYISNHVTIDSGTVEDTIIESNILILCHSHVGHDSRICDGSFIGAGCVLAGHTIMKAESSLACGVTILPRKTLWEKSMAGAGSIVTKNIPMGEIWMGNPARFLKKNTRKL